MAEVGDGEKELLAEYYAIRKEYNRLSKTEPADVARRAQLKGRYYELDRQYGELIGASGEAATHSSSGDAVKRDKTTHGGLPEPVTGQHLTPLSGAEPGEGPDADGGAKQSKAGGRHKGEVLWEGVLDKISRDATTEAVDWIETQTPVEEDYLSEALGDEVEIETPGPDVLEETAPPFSVQEEEQPEAIAAAEEPRAPEQELVEAPAVEEPEAIAESDLEILEDAGLPSSDEDEPVELVDGDEEIVVENEAEVEVSAPEPEVVGRGDEPQETAEADDEEEPTVEALEEGNESGALTETSEADEDDELAIETLEEEVESGTVTEMSEADDGDALAVEMEEEETESDEVRESSTIAEEPLDDEVSLEAPEEVEPEEESVEASSPEPVELPLLEPDEAETVAEERVVSREPDGSVPLEAKESPGEDSVEIDVFASIVAAAEEASAAAVENIHDLAEPIAPGDDMSEMVGAGIRPIECPSCGEKLPAGTERCTACNARLMGKTDSEAEELRLTPILEIKKLYSAEQEDRTARVLTWSGWLMIICGALLALSFATGIGSDSIVGFLESMDLYLVAEVQYGLILSAAVMLLGGTLIGIGAFVGRSIRVVVPLHELARTGKIEQLERALALGEDIDEPDRRGSTPLHFAIVAGQREVASVLVANGANLEVGNDRGDTALHMAAANRDLGLVNYLIDNGAKIRAVNRNGSSLIHVAAWVGDVELVKLLDDKGLELEARTQAGYSPLHFAAQGGNADVAQHLLSQGVDPDSGGASGSTPLCAASRNGHLGIVKLLLDAGAEVNVKEGHAYESPLSIALENDRTQVAQLLRERGAKW